MSGTEQERICKTCLEFDSATREIGICCVTGEMVGENNSCDTDWKEKTEE